MARYEIDADAITKKSVRFLVEAKNVEEALDRFDHEEGVWADQEDEEVVQDADEIDPRYITNLDTGEEVQVI